MSFWTDAGGGASEEDGNDAAADAAVADADAPVVRYISGPTLRRAVGMVYKMIGFDRGG